MQVAVPTREINLNSKYPGLNTIDQKEVKLHWNGTEYLAKASEIGEGDRPIVVYHGAEGSDVAIQFLEQNTRIIGNTLFSPQSSRNLTQFLCNYKL